MKKLLFEQKSKFNIIDFQLSHNELLLRSYATKDRGYNIDILFKGVNSMNVISTYRELSINAVLKEQGQTAFYECPENFVFELIDNRFIKTYIEAAAIGIFKNNLNFNETSLGDFMWSKENECIYWSNDDDEFKRHFF